MFASSTKILIIDDMATMRKIVRKHLASLGFENVTDADDGATAWPLIEEAHGSGEPYELIISDWNMPQLSGLELLKKCRADERFAADPFILLTAEAEKDQILEAIKAGVSQYITKPFKPDTLKEKMIATYAAVQKKAAG